MKSRYVLILGVLLLGVVLFMRPALSSAAAEPISAVQAPAAAADPAQLTQACVDAHKLPAAELGQAMNKMMSDPKLAGQMSQFMNSPEARSSMGSMMNGAAGSMMGGWQNSQNGGK